MVHSKKLLFISLALQLVPLTAAAATKQLSVSEAQDVFGGKDRFGARNSAGSVTLKGFVPKICAEHFSFRTENRAGQVGVIIEDRGGSDCVKKFRSENPSEKDKYGSESFVKLSELTKNLEINTDVDAELVLQWTPIDQDDDMAKHESLGLKFVSQKTLDAQERARLAEEATKIAEAKRKRVENLVYVAKNCRDSADNNRKALRAIEELVRTGKLSLAEAGEERRSVSDSQLKLIKDKLARASSSELDGLRSDVRLWTRKSRPLDDSADDKASDLTSEIVKRDLKLNKFSAEAYDRAEQSMNDLLESGSVSDGKRKHLENHLSEIKIGQTEAKLNSVANQYAMFLPAGTDPQMIQQQLAQHPIYQNHLRRLQQEAFNACSTSMMNKDGWDEVSFEACNSKRMSLMQSQQLLSGAANRVVERQNFLRQFNTQMPTPQAAGMPLAQPQYMGAAGVYGQTQMGPLARGPSF